MKILIIANGYPDEKDPQFGCFERDQAIALANLEHQVSIMYVDRRFRLYKRHIGIIKKNFHNYSVYGMFYLPLGWLLNIFTYKIYYYIVKHMFMKIYNVYCKENGIPDVIYAHYIWNIAYAASLKEINQTPLVGIEHWSGMTFPALSRIAYFYGNIAYSNADKLLAVSQSLQSHIKRHFSKDSIVVYDMLGQEFITSKILKRKVGNEFIFIAVGSLLPVKDYSMLISAFGKSKLAERGCVLKIVGEGSEHAVLEKVIQDSRLNSNVFLMGRKTKDDIIDLLATSHVFVLSSKAETFGVACIEALSQGLPAVATKCGGPEEFIDESNGILVEPGNDELMSKALINIYENYSKFDRIAIAERCRLKFAPQTIAKQLTDVFEEVLKKKNK